MQSFNSVCLVCEQPQLQPLHFLINHFIHIVMDGFWRTKNASVDFSLCVNQCYLLPLWFFFFPDNWLMFCRSVCYTHTLYRQDMGHTDSTEVETQIKTEEKKYQRGWHKQDWQQKLQEWEQEKMEEWWASNQKLDSGNKFHLILSLPLPLSVCMCWQICYCLSWEIGYRKTHPVII